MSYKFQKGDAKLGGAVQASALTGTINPASLSDADTGDIAEGSNLYYTEARWDSKMAAADSDDLSEGASNLYFTDARARAAVSVTDNGGDGALAYDSSTGVISFTGPSAAEVRAHFSGAAGVDLSSGAISVNVDDSSLEINADALRVKALGVTNAMLAGAIADGKLAEDYVKVGEFSGSADAWVATKDTDDLSEGASNLYYTDARSRAAVSVTDAGGDGSMAYNSSTGVLTYTGPSASEVRAHFSGAAGIDLSAGAIAVNVDDSSLEISGDALQVKASGVTNAMLAGAIADGKLAEDYVKVGEFSGSADAWVATKDTDDLSEGASNLYYTDARARAAVSVTDAGGDGSMAYDNSTGVFTFTGPSAAEVRAHFSAGDAIGIASGVVAFTGSTDDVSEGSNLYYTDARARAAVSVTDAGGDGSMAYNSSTGVFTYTGPSAAEVRAHFSAGDAIAISSGQVSVDSSIAGHGLNISSGVLSAQHSVKSIGITNANADYGMNFQSGGTISSTVTVTLPSIVSGAVGVAGDLGKVVMIKAAELSGAGKVTVACAGSSTIDGPTETSLDIESSAGAVTLMVVSQDGNGIWAII